jgi:hypothetical protein
MEKLAVNVLVAFTLWMLAVAVVLLARALMGSRTRVANVWWVRWTRVPLYQPKNLEARLRGRKTLPLGRTPRRSSGGRKGGSRDAPNDEELGGDRRRGLVGVGREPGGAPGAQHLMGSRPRMVHEPATCFALWM